MGRCLAKFVNLTTQITAPVTSATSFAAKCRCQLCFRMLSRFSTTISDHVSTLGAVPMHLLLLITLATCVPVSAGAKVDP